MSFIENFVKELKQRNIEILSPIYIVNGGKIGFNATHQFVVNKEEHYKELVDKCLEVSPNKLQFVELIIPTKAVEKSELLKSDNVLLRYIEMIDIRTDEPMERWDALIKACD